MSAVSDTGAEQTRQVTSGMVSSCDGATLLRRASSQPARGVTIACRDLPWRGSRLQTRCGMSRYLWQSRTTRQNPSNLTPIRNRFSTCEVEHRSSQTGPDSYPAVRWQVPGTKLILLASKTEKARKETSAMSAFRDTTAYVPAEFEGFCRFCKGHIELDELIYQSETDGWVHKGCDRSTGQMSTERRARQARLGLR